MDGAHVSAYSPLARHYALGENDDLGFPLLRVTTRGPDGKMVDITPGRKKPSLSSRFCEAWSKLARRMRKSGPKSSTGRDNEKSVQRGFVPRVNMYPSTPPQIPELFMSTTNSSWDSMPRAYAARRDQSNSRLSRFGEIGLDD